MESFLIADVAVSAVETVPGCQSASADKFACTDDTVWMATDDER